ncbi:MAG: hypothetical protein EOO90_11015 [Pedobacter sp.]|nr:MAG: hypothetical protein EOO90_11015 [Pedobacter sp.]
MTRPRFLFFIILFLGYSNVYAQDISVNGVVLEKGSRQRIASVEVKNSRNRFTVFSDNMGLFVIKASLGDTLRLEKRGYTETFVVVSGTGSLVVSLNQAAMLNEVVIEGESKKQTLDGIKRDFRNKGSFHAGKPSFLSFIFTPITAIYELVGRTPRNARRFGRYYNNEIQQSHVDGFFNRSIITNNTGLTGKELDNFMINYRPEYERTRNWTSYDGLRWIKESYKKYSDTAKKN